MSSAQVFSLFIKLVLFFKKGLCVYYVRSSFYVLSFKSVCLFMWVIALSQHQYVI